MANFQLISLLAALLTVWSDAAPLQYTQELKENLFPDSAITFTKRLTPDQLQIYQSLYNRYRGDADSIPETQAVKLFVELKESYPEIFKALQPVVDEVAGKMATMSAETKQFFGYYAGRGAEINSNAVFRKYQKMNS